MMQWYKGIADMTLNMTTRLGSTTMKATSSIGSCSIS